MKVLIEADAFPREKEERKEGRQQQQKSVCVYATVRVPTSAGWREKDLKSSLEATIQSTTYKVIED